MSRTRSFLILFEFEQLSDPLTNQADSVRATIPSPVNPAGDHHRVHPARRLDGNGETASSAELVEKRHVDSESSRPGDSTCVRGIWLRDTPGNAFLRPPGLVRSGPAIDQVGQVRTVLGQLNHNLAWLVLRGRFLFDLLRPGRERLEQKQQLLEQRSWHGITFFFLAGEHGHLLRSASGSGSGSGSGSEGIAVRIMALLEPRIAERPYGKESSSSFHAETRADSADT